MGTSIGRGAACLGGRPLQVRAPMRVALPLVPVTIEAAHKKGAGSTKNGRDSQSKRRGVKVYGGQPVPAGGIIIRQLGTKVRIQAFQIVVIPLRNINSTRECRNVSRISQMRGLREFPMTLVLLFRNLTC